MPQTGMALETMSNLWGRTLNPLNTNFGAGGSSGGDGALVALRGAPVAPMTDIGGSIRAPAAFNGLYAIRPSADRIPKTGLHSWNPGQMSIRVSMGPACHSVRDLKLVTPVLNYGTKRPADPSCSPIPWTVEPIPTRKLHFGVLREDGVVKPHPPIKRALTETVDRLRAAGHHVTEITLPFSAWDIARSTFKLYFQTGAAEAKALIAKTGESTLPVFKQYLDIFDIKELSVANAFQVSQRCSEWSCVSCDSLHASPVEPRDDCQQASFSQSLELHSRTTSRRPTAGRFVLPTSAVTGHSARLSHLVGIH